MGGFFMGMGRMERRIRRGSVLCGFLYSYIKKGCMYYLP